MEKKFQAFLDNAFAPYGNFPARADVTQELLANLQEKYADLKKQGKSDDEAYQATIDSFGDVAEIMKHIPVLATWIIRSKNRPLEKGILLPLCLQTKVGEDKIGSRQHILMLEQRQSHVKEELISWVVFLRIFCS